MTGAARRPDSRGAPDDGQVVCVNHGRLAANRRLDLELESELVCQLREARQVIFELRRFAGVFPEQDLVVDQVKDRLGVGLELGLLLQGRSPPERALRGARPGAGA